MTDNSVQETTAGAEQNAKGMTNTSVPGVFEKGDQVVAKLEQARQMIHDALGDAEYGQPLGSREYDRLKVCLSPACTALSKAVNYVSDEQRYVWANGQSQTTTETGQSDVNVSNVTPPCQIHSALTPEMLDQITTYIQTTRDGLEKHKRTAYNTIGPSYEAEYQEFERLASTARMALNALLKFWQGVEPRSGILR